MWSHEREAIGLRPETDEFENMADNVEGIIPPRQAARWRRRIVEGRWILVAAAAVIVYFVTAGGLPLTVGLVGYGLIFGATLLVPRRAVRLRSTTDAISMTEQAFREAFVLFADTLPDPCFLIDHRSLIVHRNPIAAAQNPGATIGNPIAFSVRHPELLAAIARARTVGAPQRVEIHITAPNEVWFSVFAAPLRLAPSNGSRGVDWIVVSMFNLTEQKRVEAMRGDFIANASHELRTPLTSLIGFIDTLQGPAANDADAREKFLNIMRSQAGRMSTLIDGLLSLSRIELRQHMRPTGTVDLSRTISEVIEGLQIQAREANVLVQFDDQAANATVSGDREELYEVLENLIDNAIKYGADGKEIEINLSTTQRPGFVYCLNVIDHGVGVAAEHVPRLTERFYRVDAEANRKKKGTGLGLAIVKHILNRHGAKMSITSAPGKGTTVEILFPR